MPHKYNVNDIAFLIESNRFIRKVKITKYSGGLYLVKFADGEGGIKVRENRLYASEEEAKAVLPKVEEKPAPRCPRTPWD